MRVLIVITVDNNYSGGHQMSAADIGSEYIKNGHEIHYAVNTHSVTVKQYNDQSIIHHLPYNGNFLGYFSSGWILYKLIRDHGIELVIAMDKPSTFHASIPVAISQRKFVPIIPGGSSDDINIRPLNVNLIVVFSEENKQTLIQKWGFDKEKIRIITGRIDSSKFHLKSTVKKDSPLTKIAFVSRIHEQKRKSFKNFVDQLKKLPDSIDYQVDVIGDGEDITEWKKGLLPEMEINFAGHKRIDGNALHDYDLVVGQGRCVIEAIFSGIPAAVCGSEGYKGVVTVYSAQKFEKTNFTGRSLNSISDLSRDIANLNNHDEDVRNYIFSKYDVSQLYIGINEVVGHYHLIYNPIKMFFSNIRSILSKL